MDDPDLDHALRPLAAFGLYRNNVFGVTGLPVDASPGQIRRRREEADLAARLAAPTNSRDGGSAQDTEAVRAAFESLGNPVTRLAHELLWLWQDDGAGPDGLSEHSAGIRDHRAALERECSLDPMDPESAEAAELDPVWKRGLAAWAAVLSSEDLWAWAKGRVREIDDPRLTTGTVRRLRNRLPLLVLGVHAALAIRGTEHGPDATDRHLRLVDESPFDGEVVDEALRDAIRPAERRIRDECESAERKVSPQSSELVEIGAGLLERTAGPLRTVTALHGESEPLTLALRGQIADLANRCGVTHYEAGGGVEVVPLLRQARLLAADRALIELITTNIDVIERSDLVRSVEGFCEAGRVEAAAARLRAWRRATADERHKERLSLLMGNGRLPSSSITSVPTQEWFFVFLGLWVFGRRTPAQDGTYIGTHVLVIPFLLLVIPLAAYLRDDEYYYAKVPLSTFARWWRRVVLTLTAVVVALNVGPAALWIPLIAAVGVVWVGIRERRLQKWVLDHPVAAR